MENPTSNGDDLAEFAQRLILARRRIFRTRARLGRASGVRADTIRTYEESRNYPHPTKLRPIVTALGVTADWLYWGITAGLSGETRALLEGPEVARKPRGQKNP